MAQDERKSKIKSILGPPPQWVNRLRLRAHLKHPGWFSDNWIRRLARNFVSALRKIRRWALIVGIPVIVMLMGAYALWQLPPVLVSAWDDKGIATSEDRLSSTISAAQIVTLSIGGVFALFGLSLSMSRHREEITSHQRDQARLDAERDRDLRARYISAVELLSNNEGPIVRVVGLRALGSLADDWDGIGRDNEVQTCITTICDYIRQTPPISADGVSAITPPAEVGVRLAGFDEIRRHLEWGAAPSWSRRVINLGGAHIDYHVDLSKAKLEGPGALDLRGVRIASGGKLNLDEIRVDSNGDLDLSGAQISGDGSVSIVVAHVQSRGQLVLTGLEISDRAAVSLYGFTVEGSGHVRSDGLAISGQGLLELSTAYVYRGGHLNLNSTEIRDGGRADLTRLRVHEDGEACLGVGRLGDNEDAPTEFVFLGNEGEASFAGWRAGEHGAIYVDKPSARPWSNGQMHLYLFDDLMELKATPDQLESKWTWEVVKMDSHKIGAEAKRTEEGVILTAPNSGSSTLEG